MYNHREPRERVVIDLDVSGRQLSIQQVNAGLRGDARGWLGVIGGPEELLQRPSGQRTAGELVKLRTVAGGRGLIRASATEVSVVVVSVVVVTVRYPSGVDGVWCCVVHDAAGVLMSFNGITTLFWYLFFVYVW